MMFRHIRPHLSICDLNREIKALEGSTNLTEEGVKEFDLSRSDLTYLQLTALILFIRKKGWMIESLDISGNEIGYVPQQIFHLLHLKTLNISQIRLTHHTFVGNRLTNLEILHLADNEIDTHLLNRMNLNHLPHLRILNLKNNRISSLHSAIVCPLQLEVLHLQGNKLEWIHLDQGDLQTLKILDLSDNRLDFDGYLHHGIFYLEKLQFLALAGNKNVKTFCPALTIFPNLRHLNLRGTGLTDLPPFLFQTKKLVELDLTDVPIEKIPDLPGKRIIRSTSC